MSLHPADVLHNDRATELATLPAAEPVGQAPFVVHGVVHGAEREARVTGPAQALEVIVTWLRHDGDTCAVWYLQDAHPGEVLAIGRAAAGTLGETRRTTHLFPLRPGIPQYGSLTAYCGTELDLPGIEWLAAGRGMPCERCLMQRAAEGMPAQRG